MRRQSVGERLLRGYLSRRVEVLQGIVDTARVFGKRYNAAVNELEEIQNLIEERVMEHR